MKSIATKFLPATNFRGSRIKASAEGVAPLTISYPHDSSEPHATAARALAQRMGWHGTMIEGGAADGKGSVFVFVRVGKYDAPTIEV